jgi:hypothetical protein
VDEDIVAGVRVDRGEIRCGASEGHVAPRVGDRGTLAIPVGKHLTRGSTDHFRRVVQTIAQKNLKTTRPTRDEIGRIALEDDEAAVARNGCLTGSTVALRPIHRDTHSFGCAEATIVHENIPLCVGVPCDEIGRFAYECHIASIR